jgi:hypothetical protein
MGKPLGAFHKKLREQMQLSQNAPSDAGSTPSTRQKKLRREGRA